MTNFQYLATLGWSPFFQQQLSLEEWSDAIPARVIEQHKSIVHLVTEATVLKLELTPSIPALVVGDWLLLDNQQQYLRLLDRKTCFKRKAPGTGLGWQFICANVDHAFIVCSLNADFNLSRIERYLAMVNSAEVEPVIVLTKKDLVEDPTLWQKQVLALDHQLPVIAIDALNSDCEEYLAEWLGEGKTNVVLGSSGVGKSTIINTLMGESRQSTGRIRAEDDKGRHTTTRRSLVSLASGAMILDTPGMRELQIADCQEGITSTFADIEALATQCNFSDCQHDQEPHCAVQEAVVNGELEQRRLNNYLKLRREEALNSASLAQRRANDKSFGKFIKRTLKESYKLKGRQ